MPATVQAAHEIDSPAQACDPDFLAIFLADQDFRGPRVELATGGYFDLGPQLERDPVRYPPHLNV